MHYSQQPQPRLLTAGRALSLCWCVFRLVSGLHDASSPGAMNPLDGDPDRGAELHNGHSSPSGFITFLVGEDGQLLTVQETEDSEKPKNDSQTPEEESDHSENEINGVSICGICGKSYKYLRSYEKHREDHEMKGETPSSGPNLQVKRPVGRPRRNPFNPYTDPVLQGTAFQVPAVKTEWQGLENLEGGSADMREIKQEPFSTQQDGGCRRTLRKRAPVSRPGHSSPEKMLSLLVTQAFRNKRKCRYSGKSEIYSCYICGKQYTYSASFQKHLEEHGTFDVKKEEADDSEACQTPLVTGRRRRANLSAGLSGNTCQQCGAKFSRRGGLLDHIQFVHQMYRPYPCGQCEKKFCRPSELVRHLEKRHKEPNHPTMATLRPKQEALKLEAKEEIAAEPYVCHIRSCGQSFFSKTSFWKHRREHHDTAKRNTNIILQQLKGSDLTCPICGAEFLRRNNLYDHILFVHEKYRPHLCKYCNQEFRRPTEMKKHIERTHRAGFEENINRASNLRKRGRRRRHRKRQETLSSPRCKERSLPNDSSTGISKRRPRRRVPARAMSKRTRSVTFHDRFRPSDGQTPSSKGPVKGSAVASCFETLNSQATRLTSRISRSNRAQVASENRRGTFPKVSCDPTAQMASINPVDSREGKPGDYFGHIIDENEASFDRVKNENWQSPMSFDQSVAGRGTVDQIASDRTVDQIFSGKETGITATDKMIKRNSVEKTCSKEGYNRWSEHSSDSTDLDEFTPCCDEIKKEPTDAALWCPWPQPVEPMQNAIKEEREAVTEQLVYSCDIPFCGQSFIDKSGLWTHRKEHQVIAKKNTKRLLQRLKGSDFSCSICGAKFVRKGNLYDHILFVHEHYRPHCCSYCTRDFCRPREMKRHIATAHRGMRKRRGLRTDVPRANGAHSERTEDRTLCTKADCKAAEPNISGKWDCLSMIRISNVTSLVMSQDEFLQMAETETKEENTSSLMHSTHSSDVQTGPCAERNSCGTCGRKYRSYSTLLKRKLWHSGRKKATCLLCGRCFTQNKQLDRHIASFHCQSFKYNCTNCEMGFHRHVEFSKHILQAHCDLRKSRCHLCKRKCKTVHQLQRHVTKQHIILRHR
ncbi:zinc finger protein 236 isoform X3 [Amia ocellicauda]|uniref:zinc finger protein 236 isoform X3 n=1 Tax=Amia ocellicauda TaxID=2972642 RepID=UPI003463E624